MKISFSVSINLLISIFNLIKPIDYISPNPSMIAYQNMLKTAYMLLWI